MDADHRRSIEELCHSKGSRKLKETRSLPTPAPACDLPAGTRLGLYRIETVRGAGCMGEVYRTVDTRRGRILAVKISREQFEDEMEAELRFYFESYVADLVHSGHDRKESVRRARTEFVDCAGSPGQHARSYSRAQT